MNIKTREAALWGLLGIFTLLVLTVAAAILSGIFSFFFSTAYHAAHRAFGLMSGLIDFVVQIVLWFAVVFGGILACSIVVAIAGSFIWLMFGRVLKAVTSAARRITTRIAKLREFLDTTGGKAASDAVGLAVLAGLMGFLAFISTEDFEKHALDPSRVFVISGLLMALLKMLLFLQGPLLRRMVWLLIIGATAVPVWYLWMSTPSGSSVGWLVLPAWWSQFERKESQVKLLYALIAGLWILTLCYPHASRVALGNNRSTAQGPRS